MNQQYWAGKRVLITGVCGTVGQELLAQLIPCGPSEILGIDNNETELYYLEEKYRKHKNIYFNLCDVRSGDRLKRITSHTDIIIHTAALKHVPVCEKAPYEAVSTNILGIQQIIDSAMINNVERVINTSTDKAVNPTSVMGTSKLMGEKLITAANAHTRADHTIFASTRFGNVLGSRGSVIPIFLQQIKTGGPITITSTEMTRFIMSLQEAVSLIMDSVFLAHGGEVFVTKMHAIRIIDLATAMIEELAPMFGYKPKDIHLDVIGSRPGEKLYEELVSNEEANRTLELEQHFVIKPALTALYKDISYHYPNEQAPNMQGNCYISTEQNYLSVDEIKTYLFSRILNVESLSEDAVCVS